MERIEYNGLTIDVPESYDDVKLGDYEKYYLDRAETAEENIALVAKIIGTTADVLRSWPIELYLRIRDKTSFVFGDNPYAPAATLKTAEGTYVIDIEDRQTLGAWVDVEETQKQGDAVLSTVLSILCRPAGEEYDSDIAEERQKQFAALSLAQVLPALGFFLQCSEILEKRTAVYTSLALALNLLPKSTKSFLQLTGGIKLSTIWPAAKYYVLMKLLDYRLRKLSRFYSFVQINNMQTTPNEN